MKIFLLRFNSTNNGKCALLIDLRQTILLWSVCLVLYWGIIFRVGVSVVKQGLPESWYCYRRGRGRSEWDIAGWISLWWLPTFCWDLGCDSSTKPEHLHPCGLQLLEEKFSVLVTILTIAFVGWGVPSFQWSPWRAFLRLLERIWVRCPGLSAVRGVSEAGRSGGWLPLSMITMIWIW